MGRARREAAEVVRAGEGAERRNDWRRQSGVPTAVKEGAETNGGVPSLVEAGLLEYRQTALTGCEAGEGEDRAAVRALTSKFGQSRGRVGVGNFSHADCVSDRL